MKGIRELKKFISIFMGLQFFVCLFLFPFGAYAEETTENSNEISEDFGIVAYSSDDVISAMHYETMSYLYELKAFLTEMRQKMNDNFANIYRNADGNHPASLEAIYSYVTSNYEKLTTLHNSTMSTFSKVYTDGDYSLYNVYSQVRSEGNRVTKNLTSLKNQIFAYIDKTFGTLQTSVQEGSANIQDNANQNTDRVLNEGSDKPAYEFGSGLTDVLIKLDEYCTSLDDTLLQINNASAAVSEYLATGTEMIESTLGVFPSIFTALITFGIVFVFARKVVGR